VWSQKLLSYDNIGIIFINGTGGYTLLNQPINTSCEAWWEDNLVIIDRIDHQPMENLYQHLIDGKEVIGYICNPTLTD
jgi:hypothetical protein